jgi:hypothetical protein
MADVPISIFISYARSDSTFVDRLESDLRSYGFDTWVDRQRLEGGVEWARVIEQEILRREAFIVVLSPDSIISNWVLREIAVATSAARRIIPIIARPVSHVPIEIIGIQNVDFSASYTDGLQQLRNALLKTRDLPRNPINVNQPQMSVSMNNTLTEQTETSPAVPASDQPSGDASTTHYSGQTMSPPQSLTGSDSEVTLVTLTKIVARTLGRYSLNVPNGSLFRVFKNGVLYKDFGPGHYVWYDFTPNPIAATYTARKFDTHIRTSQPIIAHGVIPGEADNPTIHVKMEFLLTYQLQDVNTLLQTDQPLRRLELITLDQFTTVTRRLEYDQSGDWATMARDEVERWLRINSAARTGLQVLEVYIVGEPQEVT